MQFNKIDCINKDLIEKLKDHMSHGYKLGECQIVSKDASTSKSVKDVESLSIEKKNEEPTGMSKKDLKSKENDAMIGSNLK